MRTRGVLTLVAALWAAAAAAAVPTLPPGFKLPPGAQLPPGVSLPPDLSQPQVQPQQAPRPAPEPPVSPAPAVTPAPEQAAPASSAEPAREKGAEGMPDRPPEPPELSPIEKALAGERAPIEQASPQVSPPGALTQFGYGFFKPSAPGFPPVTDAPVSPEYAVAPGDRLVVSLWGSVEGTYELEVSRSGEVVLPKVGTVRVWGVPFARLPDLLRSHLAKVFKDFQLDVNLGKLRLIRVFLVGEVASPGGYEIGALSTALNALAAAGGPTKNGTLRGIQVRREGKVVETLDLYDFFLRGDKSTDVRLRAGDTVFVPVIGKVAGIAGNVRRPAIYELKGQESLKDLLTLAGGLIPTGYLQRVQLFRVEAHQRKVVTDVNLDPRASGRPVEELTAGIAVQDMDFVSVQAIDRTLRGYVRLDGHVLRPGDYAWKPGMRVRDLLGLPSAGPADALLPEYQPEVAELTRLAPPDLHPEKSYFNLRLALSGEPAHDLELREFDAVRVFSRWQVEEMPKVRLSGEVQRPGEYRLLDRMTVRDLVLHGGNLKLTANPKTAYLVRLRRAGEAREAVRVTVDLEAALRGDPQGNLVLLPDDELVVRRAPVVPEDGFTVSVSGQVRRPGAYRLDEKMTVSDLLGEAGGPVPLKAYLKNAEISRLEVSGGVVRSVPLTVDLEEALKGNPRHDLPLAPYDELIVRALPNWMEEADRYVTLKGEVRFPGTYPIYKGERLSSVLARAGGFTDKAYLRAAKFTRRSVQEEQQRRMDEVVKRTEEEIAEKQAAAASVATSAEELQATQAAMAALVRSLNRLKQSRAEGRVVIRLDAAGGFEGGPYDVELMGGDALEVPQSSNAVGVLGEVYNPTTLLSVADQDVAHYLERAGGPTRQAEDSEIYVLRADGSLFSRQQRSFDGERAGWFSGWLPGNDAFLSQKLNAGDTVVVPRRIEKIAWMREIKDLTQILANIALSAGVLIAAGL